MQCRVCSSEDLDMVIDLGMQPWCNHFLTREEVGKEPFYPLQVMYCNACSTSQLNYTVKKEIMFGNHTYLSGVTRSLSDHFEHIAKEVDSLYFSNNKDKAMLDIGSNDGTQIRHFKQLGYDIVGVESSVATSKIANDQGLYTINDYFNYELTQKLDRKFDVINAAGVFFHLEELHSVTRGIKESLKEDGVFVVQFLYMKRIVENMAFDQIYHEHLLYYNLKNLQILLSQYELEIFDAYVANIHGGSMIAHVTHKGKRAAAERLQQLQKEEEATGCNEKQWYLDFAERIKKMKAENVAFFEQCRQENKKVWGMGAPVKGNTLLNYFGIGTDYIEYLVEKNELRKGLYSPGQHIPIVIEREMTELPDVYYVLAWNFKKEILANNQDLINKGVEFYFPINPKEN
ncbi:class I SAM-dependent methyltransferase [Taibaiella koreensis]|uniref:class I SAM-dependent methyltransferase n=1 Tax=Taibaiella koreensis TaxID=1268548 RepID=UPI000E59C43F|nr:class I SAM-dependent methyltransferase [Taibaiella koreensis]